MQGMVCARGRGPLTDACQCLLGFSHPRELKTAIYFPEISKVIILLSVAKLLEVSKLFLLINKGY